MCGAMWDVEECIRLLLHVPQIFQRCKSDANKQNFKIKVKFDLSSPINSQNNRDLNTLRKILLKFVPKGRINNIPALVLIMAWRQPGNKPLSEPMMVRSLTHICITRTQ